MKQFVVLICLALLSMTAGAEEMPQWTEDYEYLYGMNITDADGGFLPEAPLDADYLREGITVDIINGMPYSDKCMLLFLLNGHLQPFNLDDETYTYVTFCIDGNERISWNVRFDALFIADCQINYLQVVSIGLLDVCPFDENDPIDHYINAVTIPFSTEELANTYVPVAQAQYALPEGIRNQRCDDYCLLDFYAEISDEQITYPPFVQEKKAEECAFHIIATGKYNIMQLLVVLDGVPYVEEDMSLKCFSLKDGYGYDFTFAPDGLEIGAHQVFAIAYPIYNTAMFSTSTPKIRFHITQ